VKRVLVITYYWPPSGGAGVQRWLKFTKYLPEFGWQPVVYTPENPEAPVDDPSLQKDVHPEVIELKRPIWEPYRLYRQFLGKRSGSRINAGFLSEQEKPGKKEGISVWIRGNLFIPDARKFWIKPSVRFLRKYLRKNPVDAIISTGPPHSMHLIALKLRKSLHVPWIADFRDPWTEIDYYDQLRLTRRSDRKHKTLEREVLTGANRVMVIGRTMAERFNAAQGITPVVIPNGFDEADFRKKNGGSDEADSGRTFSIVHIGAMNRDRNHPAFWEAIAALIKEQPALTSNLSIKLVGKLDVSVHRMISEHDLQERVDIETYLHHDQIIPLLQSASVLYLPINNTPNAKSILTGKLFEYLAAGRPILGTGPADGDAAHILKECEAGEMVGFADKERLKEVLKDWVTLNRDGKLFIESTGTEKYYRKNLTARLSELLYQLNQSL
jgi:glycosyltransferase involved in cell wall biosynthesis